MKANDLILANLDLVPKVINRFFRHWWDKRDDLQSVGYLALVESARRFVDEGLNQAFRCFAWMNLKKAMVTFLDEDKTIRVPSESQRLTRKGQFSLAEKVQTAIHLQPIEEIHFDSLTYLESSCEFDVWALFKEANLTQLERQVICLRYGIGTHEHSKSEVAKKLGLGLVRVQTIRNYAMKKLRKVINEEMAA